MNDKEKNHVERSSSDFTSAEKKLIGILREVKFGKVEIVIQDGVPVRVDEIRKSIKI
ncbi:MAG: YezD family protein [Oscillospiraceae bacterium]|nr:YezD family protein [Oscillospiraceae bacterium]